MKMFRGSLLLLGLFALSCLQLTDASADKGKEIAEEEQDGERFFSFSSDDEKITDKTLEMVEDDEKADNGGQDIGCDDDLECLREPKFSPSNKYGWLKLYTGRYYERIYRNQINEALVVHVETDGRKENMFEIQKWLDWKRKYNSWKRKYLVKALEQFAALDSLQPADMCSRKSFTILYKNSKATDERVHKPQSKLGSLRRVDKIVHGYCWEHATACKDTYPQNYREMLDKLNPKLLEQVRTFLGKLSPALDDDDAEPSSDEQGKPIKKPKGKQKSQDLLERVNKIKSLRSSRTTKIVLETIKTFGAGDPDLVFLQAMDDEKHGQRIIFKDKVGALFRKYIVNPCEYYVRQLGPDIFLPAKFDIEFFEKADRYQVSQDKEFALGWIHFRMCYVLSRQKNSLTCDLVALLKKLSSKSQVEQKIKHEAREPVGEPSS